MKDTVVEIIPIVSFKTMTERAMTTLNFSKPISEERDYFLLAIDEDGWGGECVPDGLVIFQSELLWSLGISLNPKAGHHI